MKKLQPLLLLLLGAVACEKNTAEVVSPPVDAGTIAVVPSTAQAEAVVFTGAAGWTGGRSCTDVRPEDGCDSQWLHASGQVVRVFIVDVKEERALDAFVDRLSSDVTKRGGLVDRFQQAGLTLVRFLEPVKADDGKDLASINYALVGRDKKAVHLVTSVVAFDDQQAADARVRELMSAAAWAPR